MFQKIFPVFAMCMLLLSTACSNNRYTVHTPDPDVGYPYAPGPGTNGGPGDITIMAINVPMGDPIRGHGSLFFPGNYNYFNAGVDVSGFVTGTSLAIDTTVTVGRWYDLNFRIGNRWADVRTIEINGVSPATACRSLANPTPAPYPADYSIAPLIAFRINRDLSGDTSVEFSSLCNVPLTDLTIRVTGDSATDSHDEPDLPWDTSPQIRFQTSLEWNGTGTPTSNLDPVAGVVTVNITGILTGTPVWISTQRDNPNPFAPIMDVLSMGVYVDATGPACTEELVDVLDVDPDPSPDDFYVYVINGGIVPGGGCAVQGPDNRSEALAIR